MALNQNLIEKTTIPDGVKGTRKTIEKMCNLAKLASQDPQFVSWVRLQMSDLPSKDYKAEAQRIFDIVKQYVRYVKDPAGLELVQDPRSVLFRDGSGDCDEHASTIAAMAMAIGHKAAFRTICADTDRPDEFSHVYAMIGIEDIKATDMTSWWPADTTQRTSFLGWNPPADRVYCTKDWVLP